MGMKITCCKNHVKIIKNIIVTSKNNNNKNIYLILSSFIYFTYMGGTGPCDSSKIIFGNHFYS